MDLYPVILAGGQGSGLYPLTEGCPKALLPVGNYPLIYYPLRLLEINKFQEVTVIVNSQDMKAVSVALDEFQHFPMSTIKCTLCEIGDSEELGSANALCVLRSTGRTKSDLLVLSCDIISTVSLDTLWQLHTTLRSTVTMLLVKPLPSVSEDANKKQQINTEQDLIGLTEKGQVVFHSSLADLDDELKLTRKMLHRTPRFKMHSNLLDSHIYIISNWLLDYIGDHLKSCSSFKREVLPHLIKKQGEKASEIHDLAINSQDPIEEWALQYSSFPVGTHPSSHPVKCHALTLDGELCIRVNTIPHYIEANRMILQYFPAFHLDKTDTSSNTASVKSSIISSDSLVSDGVQLSDKSSVKRSMIGRHCVIEEKVKIINSVIMDHVFIGEGCIVQNTVVCNQVRLEGKVTLRDCTVGPRVTINSKAEHKGELLVEESELDF